MATSNANQPFGLDFVGVMAGGTPTIEMIEVIPLSNTALKVGDPVYMSTSGKVYRAATSQKIWAVMAEEVTSVTTGAVALALPAVPGSIWKLQAGTAALTMGTYHCLAGSSGAMYAGATKGTGSNANVKILRLYPKHANSAASYGIYMVTLERSQYSGSF